MGGLQNMMRQLQQGAAGGLGGLGNLMGMGGDKWRNWHCLLTPFSRDIQEINSKNKVSFFFNILSETWKFYHGGYKIII